MIPRELLQNAAHWALLQTLQVQFGADGCTGSPGSSFPQAEAAGAGMGALGSGSISSGTHSGGELSFGEQGVESSCMAQQLWAGCLL